jgi:hypothetical protein
MRTPRRWLAALWLALGLLPGVDRILLAHAHPEATPVASAARAGGGLAGPAAGGWLDCAACHARATLDGVVVDAHPERHGAAPAAAPLPEPYRAPTAARAETPPARAPPLPIV